MNEEGCSYLKLCYLPPLVERHNPLLNPLAEWKAITTLACRAHQYCSPCHYNHGCHEATNVCFLVVKAATAECNVLEST